MDLFIERTYRPLRPILPQPRVAGVAHDRQQPDSTVAAAKIVKKFKRAQAGLLGHVFRIMLIAGQPSGQIVCGVEMRHDGLFKTRLLASSFQIKTALPLILFHNQIPKETNSCFYLMF